jgi:hypothetical protein
MRPEQQAMRLWHLGADPIIAALTQSEDRVLASVDGPGAALVSNCDQLITACRRGEQWLSRHTCPNGVYGAHFEALINSCDGIWSVLSTGPQAMEVGSRGNRDAYLLDRVRMSMRSRDYLDRHARHPKPGRRAQVN